MPGRREKTVIQELLNRIIDKFGFPADLFKSFVVFERKKDEFWVASRDCVDFDIPVTVRKGMKFAQVFSKGGFRISSQAAQLFGKFATKNVVEVDERERERFIRGENLENRWGIEKGQVIVRYKGISLGVAVVAEGMLKNQVPTARRIRG
ncbi:16S rRNA (cytosine1407-C5)-methyltransferase [Thermosulfidibacter takaii ABI70S6]|uniref:16S rRNA (Cytosine1407-C5)-methyltransferase n=1 Tax=Thermosulfidibacter takaii (strain DSM 17441 / JCM 13301 / NBRC 103674 / ABI70S6) TaxID=1298851 RepID=A0A0S3QT71_THET7|nr:hypothetical protein [Thermosulfidibacter takaii]BAT71511.1 16S rRNA (cytosine1407-C5)-methyltransferase [Thermosulfidibacter takaii ABI70S6]